MKTTRPASRKDKYIIIATVVAIFIVAGLIMVVVKACGGDEPAPIAPTSAETIVTSTVGTTRATRTGTATSAITAETDTKSNASGSLTVSGSGIRSVDWPAEIGAAPDAGSSNDWEYGFLESVIYADLTGDGKEEALVLVRSQGSGAYLTYYVYTIESGVPFMLFERKDLAHGKVEPGSLPGSFMETEPIYGPGDPNCCPSKLQVTTYTWAASAKVFVETTVEQVPTP